MKAILVKQQCRCEAPSTAGPCLGEKCAGYGTTGRAQKCGKVWVFMADGGLFNLIYQHSELVWHAWYPGRPRLEINGILLVPRSALYFPNQ